MLAQPITVVVQSPPPSVWTILLPSLVGILGVLIGAVATYFVNRAQSEGRYRRENRVELYIDLQEALTRVRDAENRANEPEDDAYTTESTEVVVAREALGGTRLRSRVYLFASDRVVSRYQIVERWLGNLDPYWTQAVPVGTAVQELRKAVSALGSQLLSEQR